MIQETCLFTLIVSEVETLLFALFLEGWDGG